jgi:hypothetical protein
VEVIMPVPYPTGQSLCLAAATAALVISLALPAGAGSDPAPGAQPSKTGDPGSAASALPAEAATTLNKFATLIGGRWVSAFKMPDGKPVAELRFEWGPERKSIDGSGTIAGEKVTSRVGWDPVAQKVYYLDCHGTQTVYFGAMTLQEDAIVSDFKAIVGTPGTWRSRGTFTDRDTYEATIQAITDGTPGEAHALHLRRAP